MSLCKNNFKNRKKGEGEALPDSCSSPVMVKVAGGGRERQIRTAKTKKRQEKVFNGMHDQGKAFFLRKVCGEFSREKN
ncbi:hypothetical protein NL676_014824 [Syzygium grande]|nr:hypothetical protein NL676_014824 [Syzygium grande]